MKKGKCEYGHWYDTDKYEKCPHCKKTEGKDNTSDIPQTGGDVFPIPPTGSGGVIGDEKTQPFGDETPNFSPNEEIERGTTISLGGQFEEYRPTNEAVTIGFFGTAENEPVVGWIVCIKGQYFGESFSLISGNNTLGRSGKNTITFAEDTQISREKHAVIVFDPQSEKFYLQSGDSKGLTYHNASLVLAPVELASRDKIALGTSEFLFVPLCGEEFKWNDYIED